MTGVKRNLLRSSMSILAGDRELRLGCASAFMHDEERVQLLLASSVLSLSWLNLSMSSEVKSW